MCRSRSRHRTARSTHALFRAFPELVELGEARVLQRSHELRLEMPETRLETPRGFATRSLGIRAEVLREERAREQHVAELVLDGGALIRRRGSFRVARESG